MPARNHRRDNLQFLVNCHGSQSDLAKTLNHKTITQPIISSILRRRRGFYGSEVRDIEAALTIPPGWMTRFSLRKASAIWKKYQQLTVEARLTVDEVLAFAASSEGVEEEPVQQGIPASR